MLRVVLAAMVPCFAIGFTGLIVTTIGRVLLALQGDAATLFALVLTILIMVVATVAYLMSSRRPAGSPPAPATQRSTGHH